MFAFFNFLAVALTTCLVLFFVHRAHRVAWVLVLVWVVTIAVMYRTSGSPRPSTQIANLSMVHGEVPVIWHLEDPNLGIFLLLRVPNSSPLYVEVPYSKKLKGEVRTAEMEARKKGTSMVVDVDRLGRGDVGSEGPRSRSDQAQSRAPTSNANVATKAKVYGTTFRAATFAGDAEKQ